jgi:methionyl aminopeptidase
MSDNWTVCTVDKKPSAHFEHTILVTDGEPLILTQLEP